MISLVLVPAACSRPPKVEDKPCLAAEVAACQERATACRRRFGCSAVDAPERIFDCQPYCATRLRQCLDLCATKPPDAAKRATAPHALMIHSPFPSTPLTSTGVPCV